jgi:hypothetical protein
MLRVHLADPMDDDPDWLILVDQKSSIFSSNSKFGMCKRWVDLI